VWETANGVILRVTKLTETSSIVRWSTAEHGIIDTVAKGARRSNSRFAGKIDLFFSAEIGWQRAQRGSLHYLRECAVLDFREGLRRNYPTTLLAGYCCGLLDQVSEPEHSQPELHDLLVRALDHLQEAGASQRAMRHYERELARLHGVGRSKGEAVVELAEIGAGLPQLRQELLDRLRDGSR
jgi:DNA repair protein RecO (recombination protein O)